MGRKPLVGIGEIPESAEKWCKAPEGHNRLPTPFAEVPREDYLHFAGIWSPEAIQYDQVLIDGQIRSVRIEWFHNCAFAIVWPSDWTTGGKGQPRIIYRDNTRFFRIGCEHEWRELGAQEARAKGLEHWGMCWHVMECSKCGFIESHDSSG